MIVRDGDMIEMGSKIIRHEHGLQLCPMRVCVMYALLFPTFSIISYFFYAQPVLIHL